MSDKERIELREKLMKGLRRSCEEMLRRKAALGQMVVISDDDGHPVELPAQVLLDRLHGVSRPQL